MKERHSPFSEITALEVAQTRSPIFDFIRYSEFKRLLGQINSTADRAGMKTFAVISELPGEGKTFFVSALALGWASLMNKRVLIVNTIDQTADQGLVFEALYRGKVGGPHPGRANQGYSNPPAVPSPYRAIDLISTRPQGGGISHESTDFQIGEYINSIRNDYDIILFDTCAMSRTNRNNIDPVVIACSADSAILLNSPASLQKGVLATTQERLKHWGVNLLGNVFNQGA